MNKQSSGFLRSRQGWVLLGFLAVAAYFLWAEHRAHVIAGLPYLPFLLLLACPLMHVFMHGGHGGHDHGSAGRDSPPRKERSHEGAHGDSPPRIEGDAP